MPFPFLFYKYGSVIRKKCKFAREAAEVMAKIKQRQPEDESSQDEENDSCDPKKKTESTIGPEAVETARSDVRAGDPKSGTHLQSLERDVEKTEVLDKTDSALFGHAWEIDSYRTLQMSATEATLVYIAMA